MENHERFSFSKTIQYCEVTSKNIGEATVTIHCSACHPFRAALLVREQIKSVPTSTPFNLLAHMARRMTLWLHKLLACFNKGQGGTCIVCQHACHSKACQCSYLHLECVHELLQARNAPCPICGATYQTFGLQMRPPDTPNEELLVKQQEKIAKRKERALNIELKCMFRASAPSLLKLPYLRYAKVDARICQRDRDRSRHGEGAAPACSTRMTYADAVRHIEFIKKTSMTQVHVVQKHGVCRACTTALHDATWKHDVTSLPGGDQNSV